MGERFVTARAIFGREYRCEHCGHAAVARASGGGYAEVASIAGYQLDRQDALRKARTLAERDALELIALAACPSCRKRDDAAWTEFARGTAWRRAGVGALFVFMVVAACMTSGNDSVVAPVLCLLVTGALAIFMVGFVRRQRTYAALRRVTFHPSETPTETMHDIHGLGGPPRSEGITRTRVASRRPW